jgi:hypothetical protein
MPARDPFPSAKRGMRMLRLAAALSVLVALVALVTIAKGDLAGKGHSLIVVAAALGACALIGMAIVTLPFILRRKDRNDPRP